MSVRAAGEGPEAAARTARYDALQAAAADLGADRVLLGHTRDDQAEQVLLGLARGSGARSLAGMPRRRGVFARPLLGIPRVTTAQALRGRRASTRGRTRTTRTRPTAGCAPGACWASWSATSARASYPPSPARRTCCARTRT